MFRDGSGSRGQTSIDFAIAMGVFLVALTTVVAFMPTMIQPFTGGQENPIVADRTVSQLTNGQLAEADEPSSLNVTCTMYFFNDTDPEPCPSFDNPGSVNEKLGVQETRFINVSLRQNISGGPDPDIVCAAPDGTTSAPPCPADNHMAIGPETPDGSASITTARRTARYGDETVYVVVKVWT